MQPEAQIVDRLVQMIIDVVHPLKVILFGSAARADFGPESDIDILVVMPPGTHRRKTAQLLYRRLVGLKVPFDILVATTDDLERHRHNPGLIYQTILREGIEVYARA